jgi:hypothetical protein
MFFQAVFDERIFYMQKTFNNSNSVALLRGESPSKATAAMVNI